MMNKLTFIAAAFVVACLLAFGRMQQQNNQTATFKKQQYQTRVNIKGCSPDWGSLKEWLEGSDIPPIPGAGKYQWKISTTSDSAQYYFNQGINTYYSFHIIESMASFRKAVRFDPNSAILYWAQALAYGPNINDYGYAASPEALNAIQRSRALMSGASPLEKALIDAMSVRYTKDSADVNRPILNKRYTAEMKKVHELFPRQADAATLYADAMMLEHPWDLWNPDGNPKPWTPAIRELLEEILKMAPDNPGANHYYIHVMEPSPYASKALPSANRLGKLTPGLSHTVHMPSHIYLRTGHYSQGVKVNIEAVKKYRGVIPLFPEVENSDFLYIIHNIHMKVNNAMLAGQNMVASNAADELVKSIKPAYLDFGGPFGNLVQYVYMTPTLVQVKFGNWEKLLSTPAPAEKLIYASIIWHFGRGMAYASTSQIENARKELESMQVMMKDSSLYIPFSPFSPAIDGAAVAENLLNGTILMKQGKLEDAKNAFDLAVISEENMVYDEPRDWLVSPAPYLGNCLLKMKMPIQAREAFARDLKNNQENGWSLFGTMQSFTLEGNNSSKLALLARYNKAFANADRKLAAAVY